MKYFYSLLSIFFLIIVIFYYLYAHTEYFSFFKGIPHFNFLLLSLFVYLFLALGSEFLGFKYPNLKYLSFTPFLLIIPVNLYASQYYFLKQIGYLDTANFWFMSKLLARSIGGLIIIFGGSLLIGSSFLKARPASFSEIPLKVGVGIIAITYLLFFLGFFKAFNFFSVTLGFSLLGLISLIMIRKLPWREKLFSFKNWGSPGIIGHFSLWIISIFITLNFFENLRPIPKGYDGMTIYANLSFLLKEYGELVKGYGSYNYSLFSALGLILFDKPEFVLLTNFGFTILFLLSLFFLSKKFLNTPLSLLVVASTQAIPMINRMAFMQQKVETSLLFFSIILIALFWELIQEKKLSLVLLIGLLAGFLFGIKYPSIILVFALISALWYLKLGVLGVVGIGMWIAYFIIASKLDEFSGLSFYHNESLILNRSLLLGGLFIFIILLIQKKDALLSTIKTSVLIGIVAGLSFIPWGIKHWQETKNMSINSLLYGKSQSPNER